MTDIVARYNSARFMPAPAQMMKEAIDEIVRLRAENGRLRRAMHDIYEVYAGSEGDLKQAKGYYLLCLITEMSGIAAEHK